MSVPPALTPTSIPGVLLLSVRWFEDERGAFAESWNRSTFAAAGIHRNFLQDNHVLSRASGTVRGLHFQRSPAAQAKLVRVVAGAIWDVVVDLRAGSPTYGRWDAVELSAANRLQVFVPPGIAHGYCTLGPDTEVLYKVDAPWAPELEGGIAWDDPALAIPWPLPPSGPVIAERDRGWPRLAGCDPIFIEAER